MRKIFITVMLCLTTFSMAFAQEDCKMCGDWVGTFQESYPHDTQSDDDGDWRIDKVTMNIRIKKFGNEYKIRQKWTYAGGNIGTVYDNEEMEVITSTDTSVYWKVESPLQAHYDQYNRIKYYDRTVIYYQITFHNGYIHYKLVDSYYIEYDKYKNHISTTDFIKDKNSKPRYNLDLYKEDDDW